MTDLTNPTKDGFIMPGEFETHEGCWLAWPFKASNHRQNGFHVQKAFVNIAQAIAQFEPVTVCTNCVHFVHVSQLFEHVHNVRVVELSTNDIWLRDSGPCFVKNRNTGEIRGVQWRFNNWGKEGFYDDDRLVAWKITNMERKRRYYCDMVLEGGSIAVDGEGTLITTEECLLNKNRNPNLTKEQIEENLKTYLGIQKVVWLGRGVYNDADTDGHVDNLCCFVRPSVVALLWTDDEKDPQYERSMDAYNRLTNATDAKGRKFEIHKIHQPAPMYYTQEELQDLHFDFQEKFERHIENRMPASYVNFYIANGGIVAPGFNDPIYDDAAKKKLEELFPGRKVVLVPSKEVLKGGGNIHCITQQQPK